MVHAKCWLLRSLYGCCVLVAVASCVQGATKDGPSKLELSGAEYRLRRFEGCPNFRFLLYRHDAI